MTNKTWIQEVVAHMDKGAFTKQSKRAHTTSIKFAKNAEAIEKQSSLPYIRKNVYKILFDSYTEKNEMDSSKYYLKLYTSLNDSILLSEKKSIYKPVNQIISDKEIEEFIEKTYFKEKERERDDY